MTATTHVSHFAGGIECLSYFREDGVRVGIGVFQPGTYNVGEAETEERIRITSGSLVINGRMYSTGDRITMPKGTSIIFVAHEAATYFCTYHNA